jgi:hypothetical protein
MKQKLEKVKQWAWENRYVIAGSVVGVSVGAGLLLKGFRSNRLSEAEKTHINMFSKFVDGSEAAEWRHIGVDVESYTLGDLGKWGDFLIEDAKECGISDISADSKIHGIYLYGDL